MSCCDDSERAVALLCGISAVVYGVPYFFVIVGIVWFVEYVRMRRVCTYKACMYACGE